MRAVKSSDVLEEWQLKGWSRPPENGREWRMMKTGKPEPKKPDFKKAFKCRKFPSHFQYKVEFQDGREVRRCAVCSANKTRKWYRENKDKAREWGKQSRAKRQEYEPIFEDGYATISATWLSENPVRVAELVKHGILIVEVYGDPAYEIHSLGKA